MWWHTVYTREEKWRGNWRMEWVASTLHTTAEYFSWNVMAHGDTREEKWRGNWRMEWVASTLHTTSEYFSWNVMAHGDTREEKWRGNWRMQWVASTLHTTSKHGVSSINTADAHTSAASSRLNWRPPADLKGLVRFARKTKSGFCVCAINFQKQSTTGPFRILWLKTIFTWHFEPP